MSNLQREIVHPMEAKTRGPVLCSPAPAQQTQRVPSGHTEFGRRERLRETFTALAKVTSRLPQERRLYLFSYRTVEGQLEGLFLGGPGMGWRRRQRSEGKTEKIHESKLKWSLPSYESEESTANGIGLLPEGQGEISCDSPLDDEKESTSFPSQ